MKTIKVLLATFIAFVSIQSANAQSGKENILNTTKNMTFFVNVGEKGKNIGEKEE